MFRIRQKPPFIPRPERLRERKYVTIAAGFVCKDGIVLCADTEETGFGYKRRVAKLQVMPNKPPFSEDEPVAVFTGSGTAAFMDEVIEKMWAGVLESGEQELAKIIRRLEYENRLYHTTIWHTYPTTNRVDLLPEADLLFAVRAKDGFGLFQAKGTMFNRVKSYAAIGCGGELSDYICEDAHRTTEDVARTICLAIYMLEETKGHVPGCGGESHIAVLAKDGNTQLYAGSEVINAASHLSLADRILKEILLSYANLEMSDDVFRQRLKGYEKALVQQRGKRRKDIERFRKQLSTAAREVLGRAKRLKLQKLTGQK